MGTVNPFDYTGGPLANLADFLLFLFVVLAVFGWKGAKVLVYTFTGLLLLAMITGVKTATVTIVLLVLCAPALLWLAETTRSKSPARKLNIGSKYNSTDAAPLDSRWLLSESGIRKNTKFIPFSSIKILTDQKGSRYVEAIGDYAVYFKNGKISQTDLSEPLETLVETLVQHQERVLAERNSAREKAKKELEEKELERIRLLTKPERLFRCVSCGQMTFVKDLLPTSLPDKPDAMRRCPNCKVNLEIY